MYKCHKADEPIRGIVTSYNSLVCNSETFIKKLLEPLVAECEFAVDSLGDFKNKFLIDKIKFNQNDHKVVSVDVVNMYNNVNVPRVISHILNKLYSEPRIYFKYKNENGVLLPVPTRENLKTFLLDTFQKYSIFRSPIGTFKQKSGLGMGSSISASTSTIFVNLMEQSIIKPYLVSGRPVSYHRYADDCILIIKNNSIRSFLNEINGYDKGLKFTLEEMSSKNEIIFLDTKIFIENGALEFIRYRKRGSMTVNSNFQHSIMSMEYLKGNIFTAFHRESNACSTQEIFLKSLEELKEVFYRNSYPKALVEHRIRIFLSDDKKRDRDPTELIVVFDYTSPHIEQNICRLTRRMSNILPNFRVNISYRTIKVTKIFSCHAKEKIDQNVMCNMVYKFLCPCKEFYIGQTKQCLQIQYRQCLKIQYRQCLQMQYRQCLQM